MSSRQVVLSSAAMAVIVAVASWYAVSTFPLTQVVAAQGRTGGPGAVAGTSEAGPLERQAKPITPENPIPRRTFSVAPLNPGDATSDGAVAVSVRVVLDRQGRVGEVRSFSGSAYQQGFAAGRAARGLAPTPPSDAYAKAAVDAVRQWQYDPPANGPIAFDVSFMFAPGSEGRLMLHGTGPAFLAVPPGVPPPPPPSPPPPPPPGWAAGAVRVGGNVTMPTKVKHVNPVYPAIAQSAHVQGVVILEVIIGPDGRVLDARVLRSIPLLDQAAMESVRQWEFTPTHLNGTPVPVIMTVTVQFSLS